MRWYSNKAVQEELADLMTNREVIWSQHPRSKDKPFWARKTQCPNHPSVDYWLNTLNSSYNSVGAFIGTNVINWEAMDCKPPPLRAKDFDRREFAKIWNQYLTPKGCEERGVVWEDIWVAKTLVFDFDSPKNPIIAFKKADRLCRYLKTLDLTPYIVFSGSKGFHVHLGIEDSEKMVGFKLADFKHEKDPLKKIGKLYAAKVVELCNKASVSYADEDRSPNYRQGIIRCPYSIHPKTGQIVWLLDKKNLDTLRQYDSLTVFEVAEKLHPWDIPCQSFIPKDCNFTYITPEFKIRGRGLVIWEE